MKKLLETIYQKAACKYDFRSMEDLLYMGKDALDTDKDLGVEYLRKLGALCERYLKSTELDDDAVVKVYELHKRACLAAARHDLDSHLLYIEWNREPSKKFYPPRRKVLKPVVDALQALSENKLDLLAISLPPGAGKLLADETPVLTRAGWKNHGDLEVGDEVVGIDGQWKKVLHVFPKDAADYEVTFTNHEKIKCHGNHEWYVYNRHRHQYENVTVKDMLIGGLERGAAGKRGHRYQYQLPQKLAFVGEEREYPVDPYVLGAWLGDGTTDKGALTICDTDQEILFEVMKTCKYGITHRYKQVGCKRYEIRGLRSDLQKLGMCQSRNAREKYLPSEYLLGSKRQRLRLLAGLIDTDGTLINGNGYVYSSINEPLIKKVAELVSTFGWRYTLTRQEPTVSSSGIVGKHAVYALKFYPDYLIPCAVKRKRLNKVALRRRISVRSIKHIEPVSGNCIQVDGGLYCVGKTMIPTHNSTLAIFFITWLAGKYPNEPILTGSHSNAFVRGVYDECLRVLDPNGEYLWHDVFPDVRLVNTNAKDCRIDLDKRQRFETLEFTSIGTGNAGLYRASRLLYCDDLVSGIEVALNKERLDKLWETYTTDLRQRKIGDHCVELHIATRWATSDVIGRLENEYGNSDRAKFIVIPAMNEKDESNFDYSYGVGFSTKFYREQREIMDDVSWRALYMNQPIEREGLLYSKDELQRYFELPDQEPDAIIAVCDTKDRGSDYCSMPIAYQYGQRYFIEDWLCDNANPDVVEARLIQKLLQHHVHSARFESNSAGGRIAQKVQEGVKEKGGRTAIATKFTTANKETKIITASGFVKEHFIFKDDEYCKKNKEYRQALDMLCSYTMAGKNKHDDVPDSVAMLVDYIDSMRSTKVEVFKRPW